MTPAASAAGTPSGTPSKVGHARLGAHGTLDSSADASHHRPRRRARRSKRFCTAVDAAMRLDDDHVEVSILLPKSRRMLRPLAGGLQPCLDLEHPARYLTSSKSFGRAVLRQPSRHCFRSSNVTEISAAGDGSLRSDSEASVRTRDDEARSWAGCQYLACDTRTHALLCCTGDDARHELGPFR